MSQNQGPPPNFGTQNPYGVLNPEDQGEPGENPAHQTGMGIDNQEARVASGDVIQGVEAQSQLDSTTQPGASESAVPPRTANTQMSQPTSAFSTLNLTEANIGQWLLAQPLVPAVPAKRAAESPPQTLIKRQQLGNDSKRASSDRPGLPPPRVHAGQVYNSAINASISLFFAPL